MPFKETCRMESACECWPIATPASGAFRICAGATRFAGIRFMSGAGGARAATHQRNIRYTGPADSTIVGRRLSSERRSGHGTLALPFRSRNPFERSQARLGDLTARHF
jgi:hypothetical protein